MDDDFEGDYLDDPDWEPDFDGARFDDEEPVRDYDAEAREIASNYGILDWSEIIIDLDRAASSELRGERFDTLQEAVVWLFDLGVLEFGGVVYYEDIDMYGAQIDSETGKPR